MCVHCGAWRGSFGLEPTPELYIDHLVMIFEEVRRVLRADGTLWLNLGDSYASGTQKGNSGEGTSTLTGSTAYQDEAPRPRGRPAPGATSMAGEGKRRANRSREHAGKHTAMTAVGPMSQPNRMPIPGLKPKDLVGIPWMAAFALRRAGWWLRQEIIWHKPNPMPESTTDRCTKAHESIFLLSKSEFYFYDAVAIAEDASPNTNPRKSAKVPAGWDTEPGRHEAFHREGRAPGVSAKSAKRDTGIKANESFHEAGGDLTATRNKRSVWTVATQPFPEAHFATFPPTLIDPCVEAGTSERGCCVHCSTPWERIVTKTREHRSNAALAGNLMPAGKGFYIGQNEGTEDDVRNGPVITTTTLGWWPACSCELPALPAYPSKPRDERDLDRWRAECQAVDLARRCRCEAEASRPTSRPVVLDPFGGAGTTGLVADRHHCDGVLLELNPGYAAMAERRINGDAGMFRPATLETEQQEAAQ